MLVVGLAVLVPFFLSLVFTRIMIDLAPRLGIVDHPGARKIHRHPTPMGGGVAVHAAVMISLAGCIGLAWWASRDPSVLARLPAVCQPHIPGVLLRAPLVGLLALAATIQMLMGLVDDWRPRGLDYRIRLGVEVLLVAALATQGVRLSLFTNAVWLTGPLTVLWVVGLTNSLNFLDNMDGLSAGVAFWTSAFFAAIALLLGSLFIAGCFAILLGALLGFLRYNWTPARIFLGDAGSNFLGFWIGILTVAGTFSVEGYSHVTLLAPLCVLAVPIYDSATVIAIRLWQGQSPFHADKQHLSHRLVDLGFQPRYAVLLIYLLTITTGLSGLVLYLLPPAAAPLVLVQVGCILGVIGILEIVARQSKAGLPVAAEPSS